MNLAPRLARAVGQTSCRRWWTSFLLLSGAVIVWSLATPIFAAPDEPSHAVRAAAVGRGQLTGDSFTRHDGPVNPLGSGMIPKVWQSGLAVRVPSGYESWGGIECLPAQPDHTADCLHIPASRG